MYYRHNLDYKYPEKCDEHMIEVKHIRDTNFDENYPYLEKGFWAKVKRGLLFLALNLLAIPACKIRHGVRYFGLKNIRKNKKMFKNGAITVSNHVFMWDFVCVSRAISPKLTSFPAWKTNFEGPSGSLIRWAGGIPIPDHSIKAMKSFNGALREVLESDRWLHFFPEGSMWYYYPDIRPLKKTVFRLAVHYNKPVIPMAFSFRPRKGIWKIFSKNPFVDLHIAEPIMPDKTIPEHLAIEKLHKEVYDKMQQMCGITPDMPNYNTDQSIENYQKTM